MQKSSITVNNYDNILTISVTDQSNTIDHVPAMVYKAVVRDKIILIKDRPSINLPQLRFGRHKRYFNQITAGYNKDGNSTGVLLYGQKGTGKSLMAEELGNWMIKQDLPVVMIDTPMTAGEIRIVIQAVGPCMIYIDEFGKVYHDMEDRQRMLTLFSDSSFQGTMFVITGNESEEFSEYLFNRPQRFRYAISYNGGIDKETLEDILKTMSIPESLHAGFHQYVSGHNRNLNYDSLMCAIRESAGLTNANELAERLEILNVPDFPVTQWFVDKMDVLSKDLPDDEFGYHVYMCREGRLALHEERRSEEGGVLREDPTVRIIDLEALAKDTPHEIHLKGVYWEMNVTLGFGYPTNTAATSKLLQSPMSNLYHNPFAGSSMGDHLANRSRRG